MYAGSAHKMADLDENYNLCGEKIEVNNVCECVQGRGCGSVWG